MIVFDLHCEGEHRFEGWFGSARDFAAQKKRGLVSCPTCGSVKVARALSAPRINVGAPAPRAPQKTPDMEGKDAFARAQMLYSRMLDEVLSESEDVGSGFLPKPGRSITARFRPAPSGARRPRPSMTPWWTKGSR